MKEPVQPIKIDDKQANTWAMILHLSQLGNYVVPLSGFIAPIVIWQLKKDEMPSLDEHGRNVANWMISAFIYGLICVPFFFVGIGFLMLGALGIAHLVFTIIGGLKANDGIAWPYPLSLRIL